MLKAVMYLLDNKNATVDNKNALRLLSRNLQLVIDGNFLIAGRLL